MRNNPLMEPIGNAYDKGLNRLIYGDPASVLGAGASVAGGVLGSDSSSSAADAQSQASAHLLQNSAVNMTKREPILHLIVTVVWQPIIY